MGEDLAEGVQRFTAPRMLPVYLVTLVATFALPAYIATSGLESFELGVMQFIVYGGAAILGTFVLVVTVGLGVLAFREVSHVR